jgi:hypothetical protein
VRCARTEPFKADYQWLFEDERERFRTAARAFNRACDHFVETKDPVVMAAQLAREGGRQRPGHLRDDLELQWA